MSDKYRCFAELAAEQVHEIDYRIVTECRENSHAIIVAPHAGSIERRTSEIARAIAADNFSFYLFEGLDPSGTFDSLHITSHRFDEPQCLTLVRQYNTVISIHGCAGTKERIYLGGLHHALRTRLYKALSVEFSVLNDDHRFQGTHTRNICNRGAMNAGVQIEFSDGLRGAKREQRAVEIIRRTLKGIR